MEEELRQELVDVSPEPVDGGRELGVRIRYPSWYAEAVGYMLALGSAEEFSRRLWKVCANVIRWSHGHYTAWSLRLQCAKALGLSLEEEVAVAEEVAASNSKCYQMWNHRRQCIRDLAPGKAAQELEFTARVLVEEDPKHFHAWVHRLWARRFMRDWENELAFIDSLLADDPFNNSAWCARFTVCSESEGLGECRHREATYAKREVERRPGNESAWNYLRGLYERCKPEGLADAPLLEAAARETLPAVCALRALAAIEEAKYRRFGSIDSFTEAERAVRCLCWRDETRHKYWLARLERLRAPPFRS